MNDADARSNETSRAREELSDREAAEFARQVGQLAEAGLALPEGLRALAVESEPGPVRRSLVRVADAVESGQSLDEAIDAEGRRFPDHLRGIMRAAAKSGRMAEVLAASSRFERIGTELRRQFWLRVAYPTLLLTVFLALFVLLSHLVVSDFASIYEDFGIELPPVTTGLIAMSRAVNRSGWAMLVGVVLMWLLVWLAGRGMSRSARRRVASGVPLLGSMWRNAAMAEFSDLLALLIEFELTMPRALVLAGHGVRDHDLSRACQGAARRIEEGRSLSEVVAWYRLFPRGFSRLIGWAESHGELPQALRMAAVIFEARARSQAVQIGLFAVVVAVVLVLLGVLMILTGLYLPMIKLISALS